ncbi:MAG: hypothetical protein OXU81_11345 [Gammaproteobacteria bacterium]|nr:hypothetical protein [Gammaproteobacteria bacterium]
MHDENWVALIGWQTQPTSPAGSMGGHGLNQTQRVEYEGGEYVGQSAFGATARARKIRRERYSVYDQVLPSKKEWRTETTLTASFHDVSMEVSAVRLWANPGNAWAVKMKMRVEVILQPKAPYVATTEMH